jgi:hypothetical protein
VDRVEGPLQGRRARRVRRRGGASLHRPAQRRDADRPLHAPRHAPLRRPPAPDLDHRVLLAGRWEQDAQRARVGGRQRRRAGAAAAEGDAADGARAQAAADRGRLLVLVDHARDAAELVRLLRPAARTPRRARRRARPAAVAPGAIGACGFIPGMRSTETR